MRAGYRKFPAAALLAAALATGCADDELPDERRTCVGKEDLDRPDHPLVHQTEHLDIYVDVDQGEFVCAGSALEYERFVTYVAEQLDMDIQRRIPFYAMYSTAGYCSNPGACATPNGTVYSYPFATYHELTHGVACELGTGVPALLAEGLATSFQPEPSLGEGIAIEEVAEIPTSEFQHYGDAGHFVRWLLETEGPETFKDLYRTASYSEGVWRAITAAYGEAVGDEYASGAPYRWLRHRQCADLPFVEREGEVWHYAATFDCDDPQTLGPYVREERSDVEDWAMYQSFLIEVDTPGTFHVDRTGDPRHVWYERCAEDHQQTKDDTEGWTESAVFWTGQGYGIIELTPGLWRFNVLDEHGPPVDISITISPAPP